MVWFVLVRNSNSFKKLEKGKNQLASIKQFFKEKLCVKDLNIKELKKTNRNKV
jgi:hypothetical protein